MSNERVGETVVSNDGSLFKIVEYKDWHNVVIESFDNGYYSYKTSYGNFKSGKVKTPNHKSVCGVGYNGVGEYSNKTHRNLYMIWADMIRRCYDESFQNKNQSYKGCSVCDEWHNFQNFAKWYEDNYYEVDGETMHLDKDILFKGNKVYSPETCVLVPQSINVLFVKRDSARGGLPIGVSKNRNKYRAGINLNGKSKHLGIFDCPTKAFICYKNFKENLIKDVANKYKDIIPSNLYNSMIEYEVEITD